MHNKRVWFCELCNWEIGTIIPDLVPNTLSPQRLGSAHWVQFRLLVGSQKGGRCAMRAFPKRWLVNAAATLNCCLAIRYPACQTHDPVAGGACCNENTFIGGWIYQVVCIYSHSSTDQVSSFVALLRIEFSTASEGGGQLKEARPILMFVLANLRLCLANLFAEEKHWRCASNLN